MYTTLDNTKAFVALPVILAVLLVALSMPVTCAYAAAQPRPAGGSPQPVAAVSVPIVPEGTTLAHTQALHANANRAHHPAPSSAPAPVKQPVPQPMSSDTCEHSIPTVLQPASAVEQVKALDVAVAAATPVVVPVVAFAVVVDDTPGDPPGVTLTASHLRI